MTHYVGILDGAKKVWGVRIPDVPGCHGGGATPEAAIADVILALREFAADGPLPRPRHIEDVRADSEAEFDPKSESYVLIPLIAEQHQSVRANISLDKGHLEAIDAAAAMQGMTRSRFLEAAAFAVLSPDLRTVGIMATPQARVEKQKRPHSARLLRDAATGRIFDDYSSAKRASKKAKPRSSTGKV